MSLVRMAVGGYRCFADRQNIELRPITVVLGRNNSGKSALVRAPVVLNTGIHTDSPAPLDLDQLGEEMLDSFTDLIHGNRPHRRSLHVELGLDDGRSSHRMTAKIQHIDEYRTQVVSDLELSTDGVRLARLEWELNDPTEPRYTIEVADDAYNGVPVPFYGLLPRASAGWLRTTRIPEDVATQLLDSAYAIRDSYPTVRYFGPFRERPRRRYRLPGRMPTEVGMTGEYAARILASDAARHQRRLIEQINSDLGDHLPGWRLDVVERGGMWSVVLTSEEDDDLSVNLADAGTGVAQAMPIFVQRAVDLLNPPSRPVLEIIEQPELHLHPAAHAALADLYLAAVARTSTRFLIETHSETLLLRLRRRIAEGLDPATVAVYFVDQADGVSHARRIHVDADGNLDYWPTGVFSEDYEETQALARAQWKRQDAGAR